MSLKISLIIYRRDSITVLKSHDLLHIFGFLDYQDLLKCRLVCNYWYQLIKHEAKLMDRFRFKLKLNSGSVVNKKEPPFSIMRKTRIKLKSITIKEDFLEPGNSIAAVEANRSKISALSTMLSDINAAETVTEMIVHARDNEPRTNALLLETIVAMKNLTILRFTLTSFVHSLETMILTEQCKSLEHLQIIHTDCKRLIITDFVRLLQIFPNIKRIDVTPYEAMLLGENIFQAYASLIKSVEKLEAYTLIELANIPNISLSHISYECNADDNDDVTELRDFLSAHDEIETMSLTLLNGSSAFFDHPLKQVTNLFLVIDKSPLSAQMEYDLQLGNIIKWTPNIVKLGVKFKGSMEHQFGHQVFEMKSLNSVTLARFSLDCLDCCATMLQSIVHVKSLRLLPRRGRITLEQLATIGKTLKELERLELFFDDSSDLRNHFRKWPAMPKLKVLVVNRVGYLSNQGILNLHTKCPLLEVIKFYSLRGSNINSLLKLTFESFPNIKSITFRGGSCTDISHFDYIEGKVGWRLKELDISAYITPPAIIQLFKSNDFLEIIRCKYGSLVITRRIYYEVEILKAYTFKSIEQPLRNRKRLHLDDDPSSDSETSDSEESSSSSSYDSDDDDDDED